VAGYRVLRELGAGGMGSVFEVHDQKMDRRVALKVLSRHFGRASKAATRFEKEAWIAGRLDHPNIVKVFDRGTWEDLCYYTMELVDGGSLHDVIRNMKHWQRDDRLGLAFATREYVHWAVSQIVAAARALDHAHERGVVHRDVKPMNLLLTGRPPRVMIADFGLAFDVDGTRMTSEGQVLGTVAYMAPEQVLGRPQDMDRRTDVYALGVTLFELLTLDLPYPRDSEQLYRSAVLTSAARRPRKLNQRVSRDLETVIVKCLEKMPADRYATAAALADDLENVVELRPIRARRPGGVERAIKWSRRKPMHAILAATLVLGIPTTAILLRQAAEAAQARREARIAQLSDDLRFASLEGRHTRAESLASEILALDDGQVGALRSRAIARFELARAEGGADPSDRAALALEDARSLGALLPAASWPVALRAFFLEELGRRDEAAAAWREAERLRGPDPSADDLYFDGLLAYDRKEYGLAVSHLSEASAKRPHDVEALELRGRSWQELDELERAAQDYRVVLGLKPEYFPATYRLGSVLTELGELDEGLRFLRRSAELEPTRVEPLNGLAFNAAERARRAVRSGDRDAALELQREAERYAANALAIGPDAWTHINLGASLMEQHGLLDAPPADLVARATEHYRQALELSRPGLPGADPAAYIHALNNLCDAAIRSGRAAEALATCEEATRLLPEEAVAHYNLAGAYALAGRAAEALDALTRNVDLGDRDWQYLEHDRWFDGLRDDRRYREIVERMRSATGERTSGDW
jgi:tetratricopeptide (TPR) repeat protein